MKIDIRQHWADDPTLWRTTFWFLKYPFGRFNPCFQPLIDKAQHRFIVNMFFQHPHQPIMVEVIEEAFNVRFNYVPVTTVLKVER